MAIDPDTDDAELADDEQFLLGSLQPPQSGKDTTYDDANTNFAPVEPDVDEVAFLGDEPFATERREIVCDGRE